MRNNLPKVLMLGWEFPPIINGGLGVACHDLSSAMSELADITMVVPKTSPGFKMKNMNLVGINNMDPAMTANFPSNYHQPLPFKLESVSADLNPYYSERSANNQQGSQAGSEGGAFAKSNPFDIDSLYGGDVINKVMQYADITSNMASKMDFDVIHAHDWMTFPAGLAVAGLKGGRGRQAAVPAFSQYRRGSRPAIPFCL